MVFLTSLDILDTGFLDVNTRTNQLSTSYRANSGVAFRLKGVDFDYISTSSLDKAVTPGFLPASIKGHEKRALVSINPTTITLRIILNAKNTDTSNVWDIDDTALLAQLSRLPHTAGFKAIYYPVDNTATDTGGNTSRQRDRQIVYNLGATDTIESQGDIASSTLMTLWTGTTSTSTGKDLTDVNYIPVRFESCSIKQIPTNKIEVTLTGVVTG